MLKGFYLILIPLVIISCGDQTINSEIDDINYLEVESMVELNSAHIFGFLGNQMVELDGLQISKNKLNFPISEYCEDGVYRLEINEVLFDFIYNSENIKIKFDPDSESPIEFIESIENKRFYEFLGEYVNVKSENYCDTLETLKIEYCDTQQYIADRLVNSIISFDPLCFQEGKRGVFSKIKYHSLWYSSPYFSSSIYSLLAQNQLNTDLKAKELYEELVKGTNDYEYFALRSCFWEYGSQSKNIKYIQVLFNTSDAFDKDCLVLDSIPDLISKPEYLKIDGALKRNSGVLFISKSCNNKELISIIQKRSVVDNLVVINTDTVSNNLLLNNYVVGVPTLLVSDDTGKILQRFNGTESINNFSALKNK